jgi:hypothetical protein
VPNARALAELRQQLSPEQWSLLLKAGLCVACQLALREADFLAVDLEEDYGRPFPEEIR